MKRIVIFCALCALWGCRQANAPQTEPIALYYSIAEQSKTDLLTQGDEIGVFAAVEGTENYFLDNTKYTVEADGRSLSTAPAVYYPEAKQAVTFMAYLPFGGSWDGGLGTFSVPSDQTTATALKQADLCWATASSTPVATPVPLQFAHKMARLLITTNEPTTKIAIPNVFSGGILDIKTGAFTNTLKSEVFTTGTELILPAQTVTRLVLTVAGVEYTFDGAILLESAKTTSISLTLNPTTKTATLAGSSTTDWTGSSSQGNPTQAVSNVLTMHWPNYLPEGATPDKVTLTINNTEYTVSSGITYADQMFTIPFASSALRYPYTITKIAFFRGSISAVPACTQLLGATIYKSGLSTIGIKDPANAVLINGLWWATGNLVAVSKDNNHECKIGAPGDHGLYFQFGSLIGWKGGAQTNGGTGVGFVAASMNDAYWGGATAWSWANDAMVWPVGMVSTPSAWQSIDVANVTTLNSYYFNYSSGVWANAGQDIRTFNLSVFGDSGSGNLGDGRYVKKGIGDPCTYYLGDAWRLPTGVEYAAICKNQLGTGVYYSWDMVGGSWIDAPVIGGNVAENKLFFPASGYRYQSNGLFAAVTIAGYGWSSSLNITMTASTLYFTRSFVYPQANGIRSHGFPVRCVRE